MYIENELSGNRESGNRELYLSSESISKSAEEFNFSLKFSETIMNVLIFNYGFTKYLSLFSILDSFINTHFQLFKIDCNSVNSFLLKLLHLINKSFSLLTNYVFLWDANIFKE